MEPVLKPLVYREPLRLVERHRERGEPVTSSPRRCRRSSSSSPRARLRRRGRLDVRDRRRRLHGPRVPGAHGAGKAAAVRELAEREGIDLAASTAYSDSHTDLPFLEAVGHPVAVNPDRALRRVARERGWPILSSELAYPRAAAPSGAARASRSCSARRRLLSRQACGRERRALGFAEEDAAVLAAHFDDAERAASSGTATRGSTGSRRSPTRAGRAAAGWSPRPASSAGTAPARSATSLPADLRRPARRAAGAARVVVAAPASRPACSATAAARRGRPRRGTDRDVAARLSHPAGGPPLAGTNPLAIAVPSDGRRWLPTSRWAQSPTATSCAAPRGPRSSCRSAASRRTRRSRSRSGCSCSWTRSPARHGAVLVVARPEAIRFRRSAARRGLRLPGDA